MSVALGICGVFCGCILNAICLESSVKADSGCGTLITFSQFIFVALVGFVKTSKFGTSARHIPIKKYLIIVALFFICNVCNNYAFNFNISMPLHMIFRSGSLISNMIMSIVILKRSYILSKYISVGLISLGVVICTIVTGEAMRKTSLLSTEGESDIFIWLLGISLLIFALFISALLGIFQEMMFKTHGKYPYEALFYTHLIPIPVFLIFYKNIIEHYQLMMNSAILVLPVVNITMPSMLVYLLGNVISQYMCISSVYYLTTEATSLTVTLVITLRKFLSLLLSIVYFGNDFTISHWFGTALVFIGTLIFTEVPSKILLRNTLSSNIRIEKSEETQKKKL